METKVVFTPKQKQALLSKLKAEILRLDNAMKSKGYPSTIMKKMASLHQQLKQLKSVLENKQGIITPQECELVNGSEHKVDELVYYEDYVCGIPKRNIVILGIVALFAIVAYKKYKK